MVYRLSQNIVKPLVFVGPQFHNFHDIHKKMTIKRPWKWIIFITTIVQWERELSTGPSIIYRLGDGFHRYFGADQYIIYYSSQWDDTRPTSKIRTKEYFHGRQVLTTVGNNWPETTLKICKQQNEYLPIDCVTSLTTYWIMYNMLNATLHKHWKIHRIRIKNTNYKQTKGCVESNLLFGLGFGFQILSSRFG